MAPDTELERVQGRLTKVFKQKSGGEGNRAWTLQTGVLDDGTGTVMVKFWGRDALSEDHMKGELVEIIAGTDHKGHVGGLKVDSGKDSTSKNTLAISKYCELGVLREDGPEPQTEQTEPPQQPKGQRPLPNERAPAPRPPASDYELEPPSERPATHSHPGAAADHHKEAKKQILRNATVMLDCALAARLIAEKAAANGIVITDGWHQGITSTLFIQAMRDTNFGTRTSVPMIQNYETEGEKNR